MKKPVTLRRGTGFFVSNWIPRPSIYAEWRQPGPVMIAASPWFTWGLVQLTVDGTRTEAIGNSANWSSLGPQMASKIVTPTPAGEHHAV